MFKSALSFVIMICLLPASLCAATIVIPDDQPTIQAGIDAAVSGDTVRVRDGIWAGTGNRNIDFGGRAITVVSMNGPANCIIDGGATGNHRGFIFQSGEGSNSVVEGFTIRNATYLDGAGMETGGGILCINGSSPLIIGNIITDCESWNGSGISCVNSSPSIIDNLIISNYADDTGAGILCNNGSPLIAGNTLEQNIAWAGAGIATWSASAPSIVNNLFLANHQVQPVAGVLWGSGIHCFEDGAAVVENCTFTGHTNETPGCCIQDDSSALVVRNSIFWDNSCDIWYGYYATPPDVTYSCVQDGWPGTGNTNLSPRFVTGPQGDHYLSQVAAGQLQNSHALDAGDRAASAVCYTAGTGTICLDGRSTRTDEMPDGVSVDMGYHYLDLNQVSASLDCAPASGTVPFSTTMTATMANKNLGSSRRFAGRIDITLASGGSYASWRAGFTNLAGGAIFTTSWNQTIPAQGSLIGENHFELLVVDVTPAPWNQPPYLPAGDTDIEACTVTAVTP